MESSQRAREYSRLKDRLALFGIASGMIGVVIFLFTGLARRVNRRLLPTSDPSVRRCAGYAALLSTFSWLVGLPLAFYSGFVVERRYELSVQTPAGWLRDSVKARALSLPVELALTEGLYAALRRWPRHWWLVISAAIVPLSAVFAQLFPVLIAPRFNRYEPLRDQALAERLTALTDRAGVPVAGVMQMDMSRRTTKANAFFTGIGPTRRIVLGDTMLDSFSPEEIEGVVAHETAHQVHRDIWRFVALSGVFTLASAKFVDVVATGLLRRSSRLTGAHTLADRRTLPLLGFAFALAGVALTPLQLAYSRHIERRADAYAVRLTGNPRAYASAMRRLAESNLADPNPSRLTTILLHSHPPLGERVEVAEGMARA